MALTRVLEPVTRRPRQGEALRPVDASAMHYLYRTLMILNCLFSLSCLPILERMPRGLRLEVGWAVECDALACGGVHKGDALGMEHQAIGGAAVEAVAHDGTIEP